MRDIVKSATQIFFNGKSWVYGAPDRGGANNTNAFYGVKADCSYFVYQASLHAGYNVPFMPTTGFIANGQLTSEAAKYYDLIDPQLAKPGDTIYYPKGGKYTFNHAMLLKEWNGTTGLAMGAQSDKTGVQQDIPINEPQRFWGTPPFVLRPKASTYVGELDLTGGAGTGLGSPTVSTLVNLLKSNGVESYTPGIHTDSGGVPTVGVGFALIVKGSDGWVLRSEDEIKGLFRNAGVDVNKYNELPFATLKSAVAELRAGNGSAAKALFGDGKNPGAGEFSVSPTEADRISASYITAYVVPQMIKDLGGPGAFESLSVGEFAAVGSKVYQSPNWLRKNPKVVVALNTDDDATVAGYFSGTSLRAKAEAKALQGGIEVANTNLDSGYTPGQKAPAAVINRPYHGTGRTIYNADGSITNEFVMQADSADGRYKKGDTVCQMFGKDLINGTNFEYESILRADGTAYERVLSADKTTETITQWNDEGVTSLQFTRERATGRKVGGFIINDQEYDAGGNAILPPDFMGAPPPNVDPQSLGPVVAALPSEVDSAQQASADWTSDNFGLADVDLSQVLQGTRVGYFPGANIDSISAFKAEMIAQGYEVTQDENGIFAGKDDKFFSFTAEAMTFYSGDEWAVVARKPNGEVVSGSHLGDNVRELHVKIGGADTVLRGHLTGTGDDLGDDQSAPFAIDQVVSVNGQAPTSNTLASFAPDLLGINLGNLTDYVDEAPGSLINAINYLDATNPEGWKSAPATNGNSSGEHDAQYLGGVLTSTQSLLASIKTGKSLPLAVDFYNFVTSVSENTSVLRNWAPEVNAANSLVNFGDALNRGDESASWLSGSALAQYYLKEKLKDIGDALIAKLGTGATRALLAPGQENALANRVAANGTPAAQEAYSSYQLLDKTVYTLGVALSAANVHNVFGRDGNDLGKAQAVSALMVALNIGSDIFTPVGWALAAIQIAQIAFPGSDTAVWGDAKASNDAYNRTSAAIQPDKDTNGGGTNAANVLNSLIHQLIANYSGAGKGLIAQRLPSVHMHYGAPNGQYVLDFQDPYTDVAQSRGFDANGNFLGDSYSTSQEGLHPLDNQQARFLDNMTQQFLNAAVQAEAVAPLWMVKTVDAIAAREGPNSLAGLTTEQRAQRQGQLLGTDMGNASAGHSSQTARLIVLDLDNNGIRTTPGDDGSVLVDIDNDANYAEKVEWLSPREGILVLDRNGDGQIAGGHEMFNDSRVINDANANYYQNNSFPRTAGGRKGTFLLGKPGHAANQGQWRAVA